MFHFGIHPALVLRPSCFPEKSGPHSKRHKCEIIFSSKMWLPPIKIQTAKGLSNQKCESAN